MKIFTKKYSEPTVNPDCKKFEVNNWIISDFVLRKLVPVVKTKPYPLDELMLITGTVCRFKPTHIFEWGTHLGKSARIFYEITKSFHINSEIHSIELCSEIFKGLYIKNIKDINLHQGDGLDVSISLYKNIKALDKTIRPLFFLDGDHKFRSVKRELMEITKSVPNAWILVHDTFYQTKKSGYNIGPFQAIQKNQKKYKTIFTNTGLPGMTLLYH